MPACSNFHNLLTDQFKNDPMNVEVGSLIIDGRHLDFKYKDLILYSKQVEELSINVYATILAYFSKFSQDTE